MTTGNEREGAFFHRFSVVVRVVVVVVVVVVVRAVF